MSKLGFSTAGIVLSFMIHNMDGGKKYGLCIDVDIARIDKKNVIIGFGAALMDMKLGDIIRHKRMGGFKKGVRIDNDHWETYWAGNYDVLRWLVNDESIPRMRPPPGAILSVPLEEWTKNAEMDYLQRRMHGSLLTFIRDAEFMALEEKAPLFMVSYDATTVIGAVNEMIERFSGAAARLPTSTISSEEGRAPMFFDLESMKHTILPFINSADVYEGKWEIDQTIHRLSGLPDHPALVPDNSMERAMIQLYQFRDLLEVQRRYALTIRPEIEG